MATYAHYPRLRALDVQQVLHADRPYFLLRDPLRIAEGHLLVPQWLGPVLALCDGTLSPRDIGAQVRREWGLPLPDDRVEELIEALDEAAMLENGAFARRLAAALDEWRALPSRPMALAGAGYPAEPDALAAEFDDLLAAEGDVEPAHVDWARGVALLSPHIDYARGGPVYARIWKRAAQAARAAEVAVIFGTDHYGADPVTLTRVPYATPWGVLPAAHDVLNAVERAVERVKGPGAATAGELRHRGEHSLELVATWLHHMRGGQPLPVAPILVGGLHAHLRPGDAAPDPAHDALLNGVIEAVRAATAGKRVLVVASGDLAHVGAAFDGDPLDEAGLAAVQADDARLLDTLRAGDADGFFGEIRRVQDANNVCGTAPIWLTLRTLGTRAQGEVMGYAVCPADQAGTSVVTVAGALFTGAD